MIEVFPDLCTAPSDEEIIRLRLHKGPAPTSPTRPSPDTSNKNTITRTVSRWIFVLVVFLYLILSKLASRSASDN
jgi:ubiquitin-conjugating enzyme E2 J2